MAKLATRAQDAGVSMKRLRAKTANRLEKIENTLVALRWAWEELGDETVGAVFEDAGRGLTRLRADLAELGAYHDLPVGQEVDG